MSESADAYSARAFGGATFAAFDPQSPRARAAAAALRERLIAIGFSAQRVAALFGVDDVGDVRPSRAAYYDAFVLPDDDAGRAARFFVLHLPQREDAVRGWLGDAAVDVLTASAAIVASAGEVRSLVSATWFGDVLIFADARAYNVLWPGDPPPDYVMPPGGDSRGLQRVAPRVPRRSTLDLCCGPGTQALAAAAYSERVTGVDVNPRALRFARFNAAVNAIANVAFVEGDLYGAVGDERFDAILANPPFVPWPPGDADLLYRGGGARGDDVLARVFAGAAEHLEPGGSLAVVADFADAENLPERLRDWQGGAQRSLILLQHRVDALAYAETHAAHHDDRSARQAEVVRLSRHFRDAGISAIDFGYVVQDGRPGTAQTERTTAPLTSDVSDEVSAWFAHQRRLDAGALDELTLAPGLRLVDVAEREADGRLQTSCYVAPGSGSFYEARPVSRAAFALLIRAAGGGLRSRDVSGDDARELRALIGRGILRG